MVHTTNENSVSEDDNDDTDVLFKQPPRNEDCPICVHTNKVLVNMTTMIQIYYLNNLHEMKIVQFAVYHYHRSKLEQSIMHVVEKYYVVDASMQVIVAVHFVEHQILS